MQIKTKSPNSIDPDIFKAYDVRGIYPSQLNEEVLTDIVHAYITFLKPASVVLAKDVRESGPALWQAAMNAFCEAGVNVTDIGTVSADMYYLAVKDLPVDGGMFISASHNPRQWNGINFCRQGAKPISSDTGLKEIQRLAEQKVRVRGEKAGHTKTHDILDAFSDFVLSFITQKNITPKTLVANGNFGVSEQVFEYIAKKANLPLTIIPLNEKPDGTFPKGDPNPLLPENREETSALMRESKADLGVAWDADGDRCFFVDETGKFIEGYFITALLAQELLKKHPGEKIIIDPRLTWASIEAIRTNGGTPIISRVGMTIIAERMEKEGALFAGEMSSHFYFRENANRDNGIIPLLLILEMLSTHKQTLSSLVAQFTKKYFISGELNFHVANAQTLLKIVQDAHKDGKVEHIEGLSVEYDDWRFNLRSSNTEPLVRLNVEAKSQKLMEKKTTQLVKFIKQCKTKTSS